MKILAQICGELRCAKQNYQNLYQNILEPFNVDVICHTWTNSTNSFIDCSIEEFKQIYKPLDIIYEEMISYSLPREPMFHSMRAVNNLRKQLKLDHDVIIYLRTDFQPESKLNSDIIYQALANHICLPNFNNWRGYNNQFAVMHSSITDLFFDLYSDPDIENTETQLKLSLDKNGIQPVRFDYKYKLIGSPTWIWLNE